MAVILGERPVTAPARRLTVGAVAAVIVGLLVFLIAVRPAVDNDLWFHLRTARWMLDHHGWVDVDPFTHTRPGVVRVQTDWLAQLALYGTWRWTGLAGVAVLVAGVCTGAVLLLYRTIVGSVAVRAGVVVLTAAASSIFWAARPQAFTFLGTVAVGALLRRWRATPDARWLWALVPIMAAWANTHGGVVYGLLIVLGTLAGEVANAAFHRAGRLPADALRRLAAVAGAATLALALNPSGLRIYGLPFDQVGSSRAFVEEVQPPSLGDATAAPFFLLLALTIGLLVWRRRSLDLVEVVLVAEEHALFALQFTRSIPFFAVVAAPVIARHLDALVGDRGPRADSPSAGPLLVTAAALAAFVAVFTVVRLDDGRVDARLEAAYPVHATEWLEAHRPPAELFNTFDWGGWLMWEAPDYRVSVDGRTDVYDEYLAVYAATIAARPGWQAELDREGIGTVLVDVGSPLDRALAAEPGWALAYEDAVAVVFTRSR